VKIVIVGAALGGLRTAEALRARGADGQILLIGDEAELPYDRPPLSKDVLQGTREPPDTTLVSGQRLAELGVEMRLGAPAARLNLRTREVRLSDGSSADYDRLVIATGARARRLPGIGQVEGLYTLRTRSDARAVRDRLRRSRTLTVVGGGFIGAEVAATARDAGHEVTMVEAAPELMSRSLGPALGMHLTHLHRQHGVDVRTGVMVLGATRRGGRLELALSDGSEITSDLAVVGVGSLPNVEWLRGSGLRIGDGVECDASLRAVGARNVYAVGDVARWPHPRYGMMRAEHWASVAEQAAVVAAAITGEPRVADALPYVWSDQFGVRLQIAGRIAACDEVTYASGDAGSERFVALARRGDRATAVVARGSLRDFLTYRDILAQGGAWPDRAHRPTPAPG
jgi:NADPH-dependent 2,4-dienoyl-CoA reductase/sulfur reductase-like enzyme